MKRLLTTLICLLFLAPAITRAQNAREVSLKFMGNQQTAIVADFEMPPDVVESALKERLDKADLGKSRSEKGFRSYQGTTWKEISPDQVDVYTRVDGKGEKSTIVILVSKGYNNFISTATDPDKVQKVQIFLNGFVKDVRAYQLKQSIALQEEVVKNAEKAYRKGVDDGEKMIREREKIEKDIADNKTYQSKKQTELNEEKSKLEVLKRQL